MSQASADRNLLFGLLALKNDLIDHRQLVRAFDDWVTDKSKALGQILVEDGAMSPDEHEMLDALLMRFLARHSGDLQKSLAVVSSVGPLRQELSQIGDPQVQASLGHLRAPRAEVDPESTLSIGVYSSAGTRFRILRPHAKGGLGEVYVAEDTELHRHVALKQIQPHRADDHQSRARFVVEAEITGGLEHPGIVPVYGLGTYPDGRPFYAMRFIRGDSLGEAIGRFHGGNADRADRGAGPVATNDTMPGSALRIPRSAFDSLEFRKLLGRFVDVCNAIEYAHDRGVLHRDLKPGNIMLGKYGETLVVDWGLAKPIGRLDKDIDRSEVSLKPASASGSTPTEFGIAMGTPAYMSPEQASGEVDRLGPTTDVYSLGATLYVLLTGKRAFEQSEVAEILALVKKGAFPRPRQVHPDVPKPLEAICLKSMALEPRDRYSSCEALACDLEHWLADEPVRAWPEPLSVRGGRWLRRHQTLVGTTAAALLVALASLATITGISRAHNRQLAQESTAARTAQAAAETSAKAADDARKEAEENARIAGEQGNVALQTIQLLIGKVNTLIGNTPGMQQLKTDLLRAALQGLTQVSKVADESTHKDVTAAAAHHQLGGLFRQLGDTEKAYEHFKRARDVIYWGGRHKARLSETNDATRMNHAAICTELGTLAQELRRDMSASLGYYKDALETYREIDEHPIPYGGTGENRYLVKERLSEALTRVGATEYRLGDPAAAVGRFREALSLRLQLQGLLAADPDFAKLDVTQQSTFGSSLEGSIARSYVAVATMVECLGRSDEAEVLYREAFEMRQKQLRVAPDNLGAKQEVGRFAGMLGEFLVRSGKLGDAKSHYEHSRSLAHEVVGVDPGVVAYQRDLGLAHYRLGVLGKLLSDSSADEDFQKCKSIREGQVRKDPANQRRQLELMLALAQCGEVGAAAEIAGKFFQSKSPDNEMLIDVARCYAVCATEVTGPEAVEYTTKALSALRQAVANGYSDPTSLERQPDLAAVQLLPEFRSLLLRRRVPAETPNTP